MIVYFPCDMWYAVAVHSCSIYNFQNTVGGDVGMLAHRPNTNTVYCLIKIDISETYSYEHIPFLAYTRESMVLFRPRPSLTP